MSTIVERVTAALVAETGEDTTSVKFTRALISKRWVGKVGGVAVVAERGRTAVFLGDNRVNPDTTASSTSVDAIRGAIRVAKENRAVTKEVLDWLAYAGWKDARAVKDTGAWNVTAVSGRNDGYTVRATVTSGHVVMLPTENDHAIWESTLNLLERNGVPVAR